MSSLDHIHAADCASRNIDDLFRGPCDCYADESCGDADCSECGPDAGLDDDEPESVR